MTIPVSLSYDAAVYATSRQFQSKVEFEILDVDAASDGTVTVTAESSFSIKAQILNLTRLMCAKYATLEDDYWLLDGSFCLPPKLSETGHEVGWWSSALCDAAGDFAVNQVITLDFTKDHSSIGLSITFDPMTGEYADTFDIDVYDSSAVLLHHEAVTGNTDTLYILTENLTNFRQVVVTITKWGVGNRRARVTEIDFGIIIEYTDTDIINMNVLEDIDTTSGQTSSNEMKFMLNNQAQLFNILNPTGIYPYLQRKQKLKPYLGLVITPALTEFIGMGIFYLTNWKADEGELTASFEARCMLDILNQSQYRKGKQQSRTLGLLAEDVLIDAGVIDYYIDAALYAITSAGNLPISTHREALQSIAISGKAVLYCNRNGTVVLDQLSNVASGETISLNDMYKSPLIQLDKLANTVNVEVSTYTAKAAPENIYTGTIAIGGTKDVWIIYKSYPAQTCSSVVVGGVVNSETYYGNAALLNITAAGSVSITTTGTVLEISKSPHEVLDSGTLPDEQTVSLKIENPLITDSTLADNVADWILAEKQKRFMYEVNWRGNPELEVADIVTIQDNFSENKTARITKQEFNYAGCLSGCKVYARGDGT